MILITIPAYNEGGTIGNIIGQIKEVMDECKWKYKVLVVGSGLAGASAAASLAELGYDVDCFCFIEYD